MTSNVTPDGSEKLKKALLIINPVSGKKQIVRFLPQVIRILMDGGYIVTTMVTDKRGDATEFAMRFGASYDLICCTGGDGTLNETVTGLIRAGLSIPVGYIPCGSTNDFASVHKLPSDILAAARHIVRSNVTGHDVGCFGAHYFNYVAAFGAFSWLSYSTDQNLKNLLGHTAYILDGIKDLSKIKPIHMKFTIDGQIMEDDYVFGAVSNTTFIAGTFELPDSVVCTDDGLFEVLLIKMPKNLAEIDVIVRGLLSQDYSSPLISFLQARDIYIENPEGVEWSLDGESSGSFTNAHVKPLSGYLQLKG